MDAGPFGVLDRLPCLVHVVGDRSGKGGDDGTLDLFGDVGHRLKVSG